MGVDVYDMGKIIDGSIFTHSGDKYGVLDASMNVGYGRKRVGYAIMKWTETGWQEVTEFEPSDLPVEDYSDEDAIEYAKNWIDRNF